MRILPLLALVSGTILLPAQLEGIARDGRAGRADESDTVNLRGWTVHVGAGLALEKSLRQEVLDLLEAKLREVDSRLPADVVTRLREVPIRMHLDRQGCPGGSYHPSGEWLAEHNLDPTWAGGIEFGNARNFLTWVHTQPSFVMHELAHAWHHQVLGYDHAGLLEAFEKAQAEGRYEGVLYVHGEHKRAYALNNVQEYFAEASEAWWGTNDFYPFVHGELLEHDPTAATLMAEVWAGLPEGEGR
jgi:hypothetical protein